MVDEEIQRRKAAVSERRQNACKSKVPTMLDLQWNDDLGDSAES